MSAPTITRGPTMANPETLHTVPDLRAELKRTQALIIESTVNLHRMTCLSQDLSEALASLTLAHMKGQHDLVKRLLDAIVKRHVIVVDKSKGGLH